MRLFVSVKLFFFNDTTTTEFYTLSLHDALPISSWDAEDVVIRRGAELFADLPVPVEIRNEARVHLWYAERFAAPAPAPFRSAAEAIDAFAAVCCCYGVTVDSAGTPIVYAPHGYDDLFAMVVRPNHR